jgi:hypothetical protein
MILEIFIVTLHEARWGYFDPEVQVSRIAGGGLPTYEPSETILKKLHANTKNQRDHWGLQRREDN